MNEILIDELIDSFIDFVLNYKEFDKETIKFSFPDNLDKEISKKELFYKLSFVFINNQFLENVYKNLVSKNEINGVLTIDLFSNIIKHYIIYNFDLININKKRQQIFELCEENEIEDLYTIFILQEKFGIEILYDYYQSLLYDEFLINDIIKNMIEDGHLLTLLKFGYEHKKYNINYINDMLRNRVATLYYNVIETNKDSFTALNFIINCIINNNKLITIIFKNYNEEASKNIINHLINLIYADVYEFLQYNFDYDDDLSNIDRETFVICQMQFLLKTNSLPNNDNIKRNLLKIFIQLAYDKEQRIANRDNSYEQDKIQNLILLNPNYQFDEKNSIIHLNTQ